MTVDERPRVGRGNDGRWFIMCPGCGCGHYFDGRWTFNGDVVRPTFRASLLVRWTRTEDGVVDIVCHSYVTDGQIQFLSDTTHALAGRTVPLEPW